MAWSSVTRDDLRKLRSIVVMVGAHSSQHVMLGSKQLIEAALGNEFRTGDMVALHGWMVTDVQGTDDCLTAHMIAVDTSSTCRIPPPNLADFMRVSEVCAGLGGTSFGATACNMQPCVAMDFIELACSVLESNHYPAVICGDVNNVADRVRFHEACLAHRYGLLAGFPCQPFSTLGLQRAFLDPRSHTFFSVLDLAFLTQSVFLLLECVVGAGTNPVVLEALDSFCAARGFRRTMVVLHLHHSLPCYRTRWWCLLFPAWMSPFTIPDLPVSADRTKLSDIFTCWPCWSLEEELQLKLSEVELSAFNNPAFVTGNRRLCMNDRCPTLLHSMGNQLRSCPCGCRGPLSPNLLATQGLHGVLIESAWEEVGLRHLHPREACCLLGLPETLDYGTDLRAALCLIGQVASPIQSCWILKNFQLALGMLDGYAVLFQFEELVKNHLHDHRLAWPSRDMFASRTLQICHMDFPALSVVVRLVSPVRIREIRHAEEQLDSEMSDALFWDAQQILPDHALVSLPILYVGGQGFGVSDGFPSVGINEHTMRTFGLFLIREAGLSDVQFLAPANLDLLCGLWVDFAVMLLRSHCPPALAYHGFFLDDGHWIHFSLALVGDCLQVCVSNGLGTPCTARFGHLLDLFLLAWDLSRWDLQVSVLTPQTFGQHCGSVALLDLGIALGLWGQTTEFDAVELFLDLLPLQLRVGSGGMDDQAIIQWLESFLPGKGVPENAASDRARAALKKLGASSLQVAIRSKDPWRSLKSLGNQLGKPFQWVTYDELRSHVADREQLKFGTDRKKKSHAKPKKQNLTLALSPDTLALIPSTFEDDSGDKVVPISYQEVVANARGIAIVTVDQARQLCSDSTNLSTDALAVVTIGEVADLKTTQTTSLQWPAVYTPTNEPVLVKGTLVNLGDLVVSLPDLEAAPAISSVSSAVVRITVYRDMFQKDWAVLARGPVKYLISLLPGLQKCPQSDCTGGCRYFHPACDEDVAAVVMDVWAWKWCTAEARQVPCAQAEMFSVYLRIPESGLTDLLALSGWFGIFIEPRPPNQQGTHPRFSVTWLPRHHTLETALDLKRRNDVVIGLARFQQKLGLRTLKKHDSVIQAVVYPDREVSTCDVDTVYEVGPLPHGLTSQQVIVLLREWKWNARPLKQHRSSADGQYWEIGTAVAPPAYVLSTAHGYVTVTLKQERKSLAMTGPRIQASTRTRKHMLAKPASSAASSSAGPVDPWLTADPWHRYQSTTPMDTTDGTEVVFTDGASRQADKPHRCIDKLEDRLKSHIETLVEQHVPPGLGDANMEAQDATTALLRCKSCRNRRRHTPNGFKMLVRAFLAWTLDCQNSIRSLKRSSTTWFSNMLSINPCSKTSPTFTHRFKHSLLLPWRPKRVAWRRFFRSAKQKSFDYLGVEAAVAEAQNPGPSQAVDFDGAQCLVDLEDASHLLCIGTVNVAGLANKVELTATLPSGIWGLTETQLTVGGHRRVKHAMRGCVPPDRPKPRLIFGAGAPSRTPTSDAGTWTGVGVLSDFPLQHVPVTWPGAEYDCGRVVVTSSYVGANQIVTAVVYGFAQSPTHTDPLGKSQMILKAVTEEVVMKSRGPRCIMGDFNSEVLELPETALWRSLGWQELQLHALAVHGKPVEPTCKSSTVRDFVWCSPELLSFWENTSLFHGMYPDHAAIFGHFRIPFRRVDTWYWPLPKPMPWTDVDLEKWHCHVDAHWTPFDWTSDSTHSFGQWSHAVECSVGDFVLTPDSRLPVGVRGRGRVVRSRKGPVSQPRVKQSRAGEVQLSQSFPNTSLLRWYKQLRRLQSLLHSCRNGGLSINSGTYQAQCWSAIVRASGFRPNFRTWWIHRPVKLQNSVPTLDGLPSLSQLQLIYEDFHLNFRQYEAWYGRQQAKMSQLQRESCHRVLFRALKPEGSEPLDFLTRSTSFELGAVDVPTGAVSVDANVDLTQGQWTYCGERVVPRLVPTLPPLPERVWCCFESDILPVPGQSLTQTLPIVHTDDIHEELLSLWLPRWQALASVPDQAWSRITDFVQAFVPRASLVPSRLAVTQIRSAFRQGKGLKTGGPDGWRREDLTHLPDAMFEDMIRANPVMRIAFGCSLDIEPSYYVAWTCLRQLLSNLQSNRWIRQQWRIFVHHSRYKRTYGPFANFKRILDTLGWTLLEEDTIQVAPGFLIQISTIDLKALKLLVSHYWCRQLVTHVEHRQDFAGLTGINRYASLRLARTLDCRQREVLHCIQDGTMFTNGYKSKFDPSVSALCSCGLALDSLEHRALDCPRFAAQRRQFTDVVDMWHLLPPCASHHGLMPENSFQEPFWAALEAVPREPAWRVLPTTGEVQSLFTDGSCCFPTIPSQSLAAWSLCSATEGKVIATGILPGFRQTINRAELWAVIQGCRWLIQHHLSGILFVDSAYVLDGGLYLRLHMQVPVDWDNKDLWDELLCCLQQVVAIDFQKVEAHREVAAILDPHEHTYAVWNETADVNAKIALSTDGGSYLRQVHSSLINVNRWQCHWVERCQRYLLALADESFQNRDPVRMQDEDEFVYPQSDICTNHRDWVDNFPLDLDSLFRTSLQIQHFGHAIAISFARWLMDLTFTAQVMMPITFVEFFVGYDMVVHDVLPVSAGGTRHLTKWISGQSAILSRSLASHLKAFEYLFDLVSGICSIEVTKIALSSPAIGICRTMPGLYVPWPRDLCDNVQSRLSIFFGGQPLRFSRDLARSWP
eukprot:Skav215021  [mRNA]  locus=scaffold966:377373:386589:+ [translate_table: standard]